MKTIYAKAIIACLVVIIIFLGFSYWKTENEKARMKEMNAKMLQSNIKWTEPAAGTGTFKSELHFGNEEKPKTKKDKQQ